MLQTMLWSGAIAYFAIGAVLAIFCLFTPLDEVCYAKLRHKTRKIARNKSSIDELSDREFYRIAQAAMALYTLFWWLPSGLNYLLKKR